MPPKDKDTAVELKASNELSQPSKLTKEDGITPVEDSLSEEDRELKERLETCVTTVINAKNEAAVTIALRLKALEVIVTELRTATASMTSVPKPLKFLRPHFAILKDFYNSISSDNIEILELRARLADVMAVLAMTMGKPEGELVAYDFFMNGSVGYV
jgi:26S proteasome regulatory subunit N1